MQALEILHDHDHARPSPSTLVSLVHLEQLQADGRRVRCRGRLVGEDEGYKSRTPTARHVQHNSTGLRCSQTP
jgi:hypothetical protein